MEKLPKYYFAYGSNMNPERMKERGVNYRWYKKAVLKDYRLVFNKERLNGSAAANIEPFPGAVVEGVLYELENPRRGIDNLDVYEGYPDHYDRMVVKVETEDGEVYDAIVYIAQPWRVFKPLREYFNHLLEACKLGILSEGYCKRLKALYNYYFESE